MKIKSISNKSYLKCTKHKTINEKIKAKKKYQGNKLKWKVNKKEIMNENGKSDMNCVCVCVCFQCAQFRDVNIFELTLNMENLRWN